ncbi:SRPBCC family protein [Dactylosporangium sp. CS-047395]|uniref:SRPBCC family protein n=1 Tax=Dactylosporangium sp. CS-047395 TaxID=3239936 RepID=UPI003D94CAB6
MNIDRAYGFDAPPEVVYSTLTDPARLDRWLPRGVCSEQAGPDTIRIRTAGTVLNCTITLTPADLRLQWRLSDHEGVHGTVRAADAPAGGTELHVTIEAPDTALDADRTGQLLADVIRRLQRDVEDNLTPG